MTLITWLVGAAACVGAAADSGAAFGHPEVSKGKNFKAQRQSVGDDAGFEQTR